MKKINLILSLWVLLSSIVCLEAAAYNEKFFVFNVGQGSCTLYLPTSVDARPVLYDCGGSTNISSYDKPYTKINLVHEIVRKITENLPPNYPELNVVISHPDADHCNYLLDVLKEIAKINNIAFYFYCGGIKTQYESSDKLDAKDLMKWIDDLGNGKKHGPYFADSRAPIHIGTGYKGEFLSWEEADKKLPKDEATNSVSLVLKIANVPHTAPHSIILMGDATQATVSSIQERDVCQTTILMAGHHGANTHGSNDKAWADKVKPKHVVFSAAMKFGHPNNDVVTRYLPHVVNSTIIEGDPTRPTPLHEFSHSGRPLPAELRYYPSDTGEICGRHKYVGAITKKGVYHTRNTGMMTFKFASPLKILSAPPYLSIFPKNITTLSLANMSLGNEEVLFLAPRLSSLSKLTSLDLSNNPLGNEGVFHLSGELQKVAGLKTLSLSKVSMQWDFFGDQREYSDKSYNALCEFFKSQAGKQLTSLNLSENNLNNRGVYHLVQLLAPVADLIHLDLSNVEMNWGNDGYEVPRTKQALSDLKKNVNLILSPVVLQP